jgi:uncharacterized protein YdbL (DUF1318 family)
MQQVAKLTMTRFLTGILLSALLLNATLGWADALESLRASGAIGESNNGYAVAREPSAQAEADAINAKRRVIYQNKANAEGVNVEQVAKVYAQEIFNTVPAGTWLQINGQWKKK